MIVNGILKQNVSVDVSREDLFMGLADELGVYSLFEERYGEYHELKEIQTNEGIKPAIVTYRDTSYHGSSHYEKVKERILTDNEYKYAKAMLEIKNIMIKEKMSKTMSDLNI